MSDFDEIKHRHDRDGWRDVVFIAVAVLLTALSIGSVTSRAAGHPTERHWALTVVENPELAR